MKGIFVRTTDDSGIATTRILVNPNKIVAVIEVHQSMVDAGEAPAAAKSLITFNPAEDPLPVIETIDYINTQLDF